MKRRLALLAMSLCTFVALAGADASPGAAAGVPSLVDALPPSPSLADRLAEIQRRVQQALRYPSLARARELSGEVEIAFQIGGDLRARDVAIVRSSGFASLDRAARQAVLDAGPLPAVHGRLRIPVVFDLRD